MQATSFNVLDAVALLPAWAQSRKRSPFVFGADFVTGTGSAIPANGTVSQDIKISDDADFVLVFQSAVLTNDAAQAVFVNLLPLVVTLTDGGSGRLYMNQAIHFNNVFGTIGADGPVVMPQPALLTRSSTYTVAVTNLGAVATLSARCAFWGFKLYGEPLQPGTY